MSIDRLLWPTVISPFIDRYPDYYRNPRPSAVGRRGLRRGGQGVLAGTRRDSRHDQGTVGLVGGVRYRSIISYRALLVQIPIALTCNAVPDELVRVLAQAEENGGREHLEMTMERGGGVEEYVEVR